MAHEITIAWNPNAAPVDGYNVYRGTRSGNESRVPINATLVLVPSYEDDAVLPGQRYFYEVTAVANGIESLDSIEIESDAVPFPPTPAAILLGMATSFGVLAGSTVTNTGPTTIVGDVGVSPGSAIVGIGHQGDPGALTGVLHAADFVAKAAQAALHAAFTAALAMLNPDGSPPTAIKAEIGGQRFGPGVYKADTSLSITGTVVLDAGGDPNAVFVFLMGSTLITAAENSNVALVGGAQAGNVFWIVGSSATLGTHTVFAGNILAQASITVTTGASVSGRLLAQDGAVTLDTAQVALFITGRLRILMRNAAYQVGDIIFDCVSQTYQEAIVAGVTGPVVPVFATGPGSLTTDGTVIWADPPEDIVVTIALPPSPPNTPPAPPLAPTGLHVTKEE